MIKEKYTQAMLGVWHHFKGREGERDIKRIFYIYGYLNGDKEKPLGYGFTQQFGKGWKWHEKSKSYWGVWGNRMADMNLVEKILLNEALNRGYIDCEFRNDYKIYDKVSNDLIYSDGVWTKDLDL